VSETAASGRFDIKMNNRWSSYVRVFHDKGTDLRPEGISGRVVRITDDPTNAVFNLQGATGRGLINEFKVGYNAAPSRINGLAPTVDGVDFSSLAINLSGSVANTGIAGQGSSSGIVVPGGLVRANSATNGHAQPYDPFAQRLDVDHRAVIVLYYYVGLRPEEAAETLGLPVGTVRSRLHRAMQQMRAALEADARTERLVGGRTA